MMASLRNLTEIREEKSNENFKLLIEKLWAEHLNEIKTFSANPLECPCYVDELASFIKQRSKVIVSLGADPVTYNYKNEFDDVWTKKFTQRMRRKWCIKERLSMNYWNERKDFSSIEDVFEVILKAVDSAILSECNLSTDYSRDPISLPKSPRGKTEGSRTASPGRNSKSIEKEVSKFPFPEKHSKERSLSRESEISGHSFSSSLDFNNKHHDSLLEYNRYTSPLRTERFSESHSGYEPFCNDISRRIEFFRNSRSVTQSRSIETFEDLGAASPRREIVHSRSHSRSNSHSNYSRTVSHVFTEICSRARSYIRYSRSRTPLSFNSNFRSSSRSRSFEIRSRSRSRSFKKIRSRSRSISFKKIRSRSRSISFIKIRSRSRSRSFKKIRSRSRSKSFQNIRSSSRSRSFKNARSRSRSRSFKKTRPSSFKKTRSRSISRSFKIARSRSKSRSFEIARSRLRTRSFKKTRSKSKSRSFKTTRSRSISRSFKKTRSRSRSFKKTSMSPLSEFLKHERNHSSSRISPSSTNRCLKRRKIETVSKSAFSTRTIATPKSKNNFVSPSRSKNSRSSISTLRECSKYERRPSPSRVSLLSRRYRRDSKDGKMHSKSKSPFDAKKISAPNSKRNAVSPTMDGRPSKHKKGRLPEHKSVSSSKPESENKCFAKFENKSVSKAKYKSKSISKSKYESKSISISKGESNSILVSKGESKLVSSAKYRSASKLKYKNKQGSLTKGEHKLVSKSESNYVSKSNVESKLAFVCKSKSESEIASKSKSKSLSRSKYESKLASVSNVECKSKEESNLHSKSESKSCSTSKSESKSCSTSKSESKSCSTSKYESKSTYVSKEESNVELKSKGKLASSIECTSISKLTSKSDVMLEPKLDVTKTFKGKTQKILQSVHKLRKHSENSSSEFDSNTKNNHSYVPKYKENVCGPKQSLELIKKGHASKLDTPIKSMPSVSNSSSGESELIGKCSSSSKISSSVKNDLNGLPASAAVTLNSTKTNKIEKDPNSKLCLSMKNEQTRMPNSSLENHSDLTTKSSESSMNIESVFNVDENANATLVDSRSNILKSNLVSMNKSLSFQFTHSLKKALANYKNGRRAGTPDLKLPGHKICEKENIKVINISCTTNIESHNFNSYFKSTNNAVNSKNTENQNNVITNSHNSVAHDEVERTVQSSRKKLLVPLEEISPVVDSSPVKKEENDLKCVGDEIKKVPKRNNDLPSVELTPLQEDSCHNSLPVSSLTSQEEPNELKDELNCEGVVKIKPTLLPQLFYTLQQLHPMESLLGRLHPIVDSLFYSVAEMMLKEEPIALTTDHQIVFELIQEKLEKNLLSSDTNVSLKNVITQIDKIIKYFETSTS